MEKNKESTVHKVQHGPKDLSKEPDVLFPLGTSTISVGSMQNAENTTPSEKRRYPNIGRSGMKYLNLVRLVSDTFMLELGALMQGNCTVGV